MSGVEFPALDSAIKSLAGRVAVLERLATDGSIYVDRRLLDVDAASVLFDSFPDHLHVLELTWVAMLALPDDDNSALYLDFNGDTLDDSAEDYRWHLSLPDPDGTGGSAGEGSATDGDLLREGGAAGYLSVSRVSWGRVRFPAYNIATDEGPFYAGEGGWCGFGGTTDAWTIAGKRDNGGPLTSILVSAATIAAGDPRDLGVGSCFTLTGF